MKTHWKVGALIVVVAGTLAWLAVSGIRASGAYYKTVSEIEAMGNEAFGKRLRVAGNVVPGTIARNGARVRFSLQQEELRLQVVYEGSDPLPDTFKDGSQALADGRMGPDGVFRASRIQAKCASKYESKPATPSGPVKRAGA
jgi:cytochrome c-type biogenesis protein CcmE